MKFILILTLLICPGCSDEGEKTSQTSGGLVTRHSTERLMIPAAQPRPLPKYPWDSHYSSKLAPITKEFFRCKGSRSNPEKMIERSGKLERILDCDGSDHHSLPLCENKEFIYPILIELLNYIQTKTQKKVVITSGHRCPQHNLYTDASSANAYSKHLIGAEVSFYVSGMENAPEAIVDTVMNFYSETTPSSEKEEYYPFKRYEGQDTNVTTKPWYNKEIFIKLFKKEEGRNFDNRHPYPYIAVQVRYDRAKNEKVVASWEKGMRNFLRK